MRTVTIQELTLERFQPYGLFANMLNPQTPKIGAKPIEFFREMVRVNLGHYTQASCSVCRVEKRPLVIDVSEFHSACGEGMLPLDGDVLIHVGPATPSNEIPLERFEVFRVPKGTLVAVHPGVWHHGPFVEQGDAVNVLIILPERTYANDCTVYSIPEDQRIAIQR
jgi:ureidoglycolate lyase